MRDEGTLFTACCYRGVKGTFLLKLPAWASPVLHQTLALSLELRCVSSQEKLAPKKKQLGETVSSSYSWSCHPTRWIKT